MKMNINSIQQFNPSKYIMRSLSLPYIIKLLLFFIITGGSLLVINLWLYFQPSSLELALADWLRFGSPAWLTSCMQFISNSVYSLSIFVLGYGLWLLWTKHWRQAVMLGLTLSVLLTIEPLKSLFRRPRPVLENIASSGFLGTSFPSGHSMTSLLLVGALLLLSMELYPAIRRWRWVMLGIAYALLVGWSRIYLHAHYPSDVLGGYIAAMIFLVVLVMISQWFRRIGSTAI